MPNKYFVKIPYSYTKYGSLSCYIYAEDEEEAQDLAYECENRHSEDYDDSDDSSDTDYDFSNLEISLDEEDVNSPDNNSSNSNLPFNNVPSYFLAELAQL